MKLALLVLCHEVPEELEAHWRWPPFASPDVKLYVHYDGARSDAELARLRAGLPAGVAAEVLTQRVVCRWGEYSIVEATRRLMQSALADSAFAPDYLMLASGSCFPIRPLASLQEFLRRRRGIDFIQAVDIASRRWVRDGLEEERYRYFFPFNFRRHRRLFDWATSLQRRLGVYRVPPRNLRVHLGSQWFCLTRATAAAVVDALADGEVAAFFRRSWIPDESVIQTLVANLRPARFIAGHGLTYFEFDERGRPLLLENGHLEHLERQPFFFARKLAPDSARLRAQVEARLARPELDLSYFERVGEPTGEYQHFLASAGRHGGTRSPLGATTDEWRRLMGRNDRPYLVLHSSSPGYLRALLAAARAHGRLPLFDDLFDPDTLVPAHEYGSWYGLQDDMASRRSYDPAAFLYEVVRVDPRLPTAFAIDAGRDDWLRSYVVWDRHATVIDCDPPGLGYERRAATSLREMKTAQRYDAVARLHAAVAERKWLPGEFFDEARHEKKHACRLLRLADVPAEGADPCLAALRAAAGRVDAAPFFVDEERAARLLREAGALVGEPT